MRPFTAAAVGAVFFASAGQAAVLDLTYNFEAELTDYVFYDYGNPETYAGPPVGTVDQQVFSFTVDTERFYNDIGAVRFDPSTGAGFFVLDYTPDTIDFYEFRPDGTGRSGKATEYPLGSVDQRYYDILSWSVDIAPIPLPASLPLLALGLGGFAALGRKQRRSPA